MRKKYLIFIGLLLISLVLTQLVIQHSIGVQKQDSHIINKAGRQRMLSQKICKTALLIVSKWSKGESVEKEQAQLNELAQDWRRVHFALKLREKDAGFGGTNSAQITALFQEVQPYFDQMHFHALTVVDAKSEMQLREVMPDLLSTEQLYLPLMDQIVNQYDVEASEKLHRLVWIEIFLGAFTFILILIEFFIIFNPLIRSLMNQNKELEDVNSQLNSQNNTLIDNEIQISEQKEELLIRNEELLEAKKEAESAALSKSLFLSNMSHEIRTPMNGILGITNILIEENPNTQQLEHLSILKFSAENLLNVINDILDISKIESGKLRIEHIQFSLIETLKSARKILEHVAEDKGVYLSLNLSNDLPEYLIGDPYRLNQILLNLVGNALKFTKEGGVTIEARLLHSENGNEQIYFAVSNTGIGIPTEKQAVIFESFAQADDSTNRVYGGTGLGLAISQNLVRLMGGEIQIESEVEKGSTFSFELTFERGTTSAIKTEQDQPGEQQSLAFPGIKKILLVDDNHLNLTVGKRFLSYWDLQCDIANDGAEAVQKVKENDYELVLMDLQMPVMDGFEATERIRSLHAFKYGENELPIIALTASAVAEIKKLAFEKGMNDFLLKPYKPDQLYQLLEHYLNRRRIASQIMSQN